MNTQRSSSTSSKANEHGAVRRRRAGVLVAMLLVAGLTSVLASAPVAVAAEDDVVRFVVLGDTGMGNTDQRKVAVAIRDVCANIGCDFVVGTGDNIYYSGVDSVWDSDFQSKFEEPYRDVDLTFYQTLGNHDVAGSVQAQIDYTQRSDKWEMPGRWYTHQHGDVLFIATDTNAVWSGTQKTFIRDALADTNANWVFAHGHHAYASNGKHGNADGSLKTWFEDELCGKTDALFLGHDHLLQWLKPKSSCPGTELLVSGAGGAPRSIADPDRNPVYYQKGDTLGFLWVEIDGGTFTGRFYDDSKRMLFERTFTKDVPASEPTPDPAPEPATRDPTWTLDDDIATNWVEVYMTPDDAAQVHASVNGGTWHALTHRAWGSWASSGITVPDGASVQFRATWSDGGTALSPKYTWPASTTPTEPEPTPAPGHAVTWDLDDDIGNTWVEVYPTSDATIAAVDVVVDGVATPLGAKSWGSWAKAMQVATGASVHFRATFSDGTTVDSRTWSWMVDTEPTHVPPASSGPTVAWVLDDDIGRYWVEVYLTTDGTVTAVDAEVDGGAWVALDARSWGSWAKSFHVPAGSQVTFRATFSGGTTATSAAYTWP